MPSALHEPSKILTRNQINRGQGRIARKLAMRVHQNSWHRVNAECGEGVATKEQVNCGIESTEHREKGIIRKDVATLQGAIAVAYSNSSPAVQERAVSRCPSLGDMAAWNLVLMIHLLIWYACLLSVEAASFPLTVPCCSCCMDG